MSKPSPVVSDLRKSLRNGWPPTLRFLEWAKTAQETPEYTTTADLAMTLAIKPLEAKGLIEGIIELGLAKFVVGRRKAPSRLIWQYTLGSIAAAAHLEADQLSAINPGGIARISPHDLIEHFFQLRRDYRVSLALPADLTKQEAKRFADFITNLPFKD